MDSSERLRSARSDAPSGQPLDDAIAAVCPQAASVLRANESAEPWSALRAAGFRVVQRQSVSEDALRFARAAIAQTIHGGWVVLDGTRRGFNVRDRGFMTTVSHRQATSWLTGPIITIEPPVERASIVRTLLQKAGEERGVIGTAVLATVVAPLLALAPAAASLYVFNDVIPDELRGGMTMVAIALTVTALFQAWVSLVRVRTLLYVRARVDLGVARRLLARTLRLPFTHLQQYSVAGLMEAFRGISNAREILADRVLSAGFDGAVSLLILLAVAWMRPGVAVVLALSAVVYLFLVTAIAYGQMRLERREIAARTATRERLVDSVRAIASVKSAGAEEAMIARWRSRLVLELQAGSRRQRLALYAVALRDVMRQGTTFGVLIAGALLIQNGGAQLGSYVALLQLTAVYAGGILGVAALIQSIMTAMPHLQRAAELSRIEPVPRARRGSRSDRIVLENLWFRYGETTPWVLRGFNAVLEPGHRYRLDGPSGAGKTTVLRLLASIYKPERGRLHVNGVELDRGGAAYLYLPQDVQLFAGSLLDNLRLLSGGAPVHRLMQAAEDLGLTRWVNTLPMRFATQVLSGATISGGQKQLIALTAAAAADVPVLLLDEAGSNLDAASYRRVFASPLWQGRTIVYVGHAAYAELSNSQTLSVAAASDAVS